MFPDKFQMVHNESFLQLQDVFLFLHWTALNKEYVENSLHQILHFLLRYLAEHNHQILLPLMCNPSFQAKTLPLLESLREVLLKLQLLSFYHHLPLLNLYYHSLLRILLMLLLLKFLLILLLKFSFSYIFPPILKLKSY